MLFWMVALLFLFAVVCKAISKGIPGKIAQLRKEQHEICRMLRYKTYRETLITEFRAILGSKKAENVIIQALLAFPVAILLLGCFIYLRIFEPGKWFSQLVGFCGSMALLWFFVIDGIAFLCGPLGEADVKAAKAMKAKMDAANKQSGQTQTTTASASASGSTAVPVNPTTTAGSTARTTPAASAAAGATPGTANGTQGAGTSGAASSAPRTSASSGSAGGTPQAGRPAAPRRRLGDLR